MLSPIQVQQCLTHLAEKAHAGIPLSQWPLGEPPSVQNVLRPALRAVEAGQSPLPKALTRALALHAAEQKVLEAADFSGRLAQGFSALAHARKAERAASVKLGLALAYPGFLLVFASLVLPLPVLFTASLKDYLAYSMPGLFFLFFLISLVFIWPRLAPENLLKKRVQQGAIRLPLLKALHADAALQRFSTLFAELLRAGIAPQSSLPLALEVTQHAEFLGKSETILLRLEQGASLAEALKILPLLDDKALQEVAHAETTGHLDEAFSKLGKRYKKRRTNRQWALVTSIGALAMVVVVGGIGFTIVKGTQSYFKKIDDVYEKASQ